MIVSDVPTDNIRSLRLDDPFFGLMSALEKTPGEDYHRHSLTAITNPGSEGSPSTYFSYQIEVVDQDRELSFRTCTCSDYRYNKLPYAQDVLSGEVTLRNVAQRDCKHLRALKDDGEGVEEETSQTELESGEARRSEPFPGGVAGNVGELTM